MPYFSPLIGKPFKKPLVHGEFSVPKGSKMLELRQPTGGDNGTHKFQTNFSTSL
jgi:hypothetical protein